MLKKHSPILFVALFVALPLIINTDPLTDKQKLDTTFDGTRPRGLPVELVTGPRSGGGPVQQDGGTDGTGSRGRGFGTSSTGRPQTPKEVAKASPHPQFPSITLKYSIFEIRSQDRDQDSLDDELEWRLAQDFAPYIIWDEEETCSERRVFYQVHLLENNRISLNYARTFPQDCGFPFLGRDDHPGDTHGFHLILATDDQKLTWTIEKPHQNYLEFSGAHTKIWLSEGKHHGYPSLKSCEDYLWWTIFWNDDCGEGKEEIEPILSNHNVGESRHPLITWLGAFAQGPWKEGYAKEHAWDKSAWGDDKFCGGNENRNQECASPLGDFWDK